MTEYTEAFKSKMVQRMAGPEARSASALSAEMGIPQPTLSRWLRAAGGRLEVMAKPTPKKLDQHSRRPEDWTPEERLRAVVQASGLSNEELGAFLRREGLHEATLQEWRTAALEGLAPPAPGTRREQRKLRSLEKELRRKDKALAEAAALLVLQKKVQALWGDEDDDTEGKNGE